MSVRLTSRYIIPFLYDSEKIAFDKVEELAGDAWELEPEQTVEMDVYNYIQDLFLSKKNFHKSNHSVAIACAYQYQKLPKNYKLIFKKDANEMKFVIREVHLVLFRNGLGLLYYLPEFGKKNVLDSAEQAVEFTYFFKELARNDKTNYIFQEEILDYDSTVHTDVAPENMIAGGKKFKKYHSFSMGHWINELLSTLNCEVQYYPFRKEKNKNIPDKALLFHHGVFLDEENIDEFIYYLTRGYKKSYKIPKTEMLELFENVRCFVTSEGCGYYARAKDKTEFNEGFFASSKKIYGDYFLLYLLSLYQSYTLLLYSEEVSMKLSADTKDYNKYSFEIIESLGNISTKLNVFLAKSIYSSVSYIQHQNVFYLYLMRRFRIRENIESVSAGLEALEELEEKFDKEEQEKKNKSLEMGVSLISILALISAFNDLNDFATEHLSHAFPLGNHPFYLIALNAILIFVTVVVGGMLGKYVCQTFIYSKRKRK